MILDWRGVRVKMAVKIPAYVLYKYHKGFVRQVSRDDSEGVNDLIADGMLYMVSLDKRLPPEVTPHEFQLRATGHLRLYYKRRYFIYNDLYWDGRRGELVRKECTLGPEVYDVDMDAFPSREGLPSERMEMQEILDRLTREIRHG